MQTAFAKISGQNTKERDMNFGKQPLEWGKDDGCARDIREGIV